jgi:GTP cyclohydrolase II
MDREARETVPEARIRGVTSVPLDIPGVGATDARLITFEGLSDGREHLAIGLDGPGDVPLVRLHSECMTGDVFGSLRCDCGPQLREALAEIAATGGYVVYLRQEGRGIGLYNKLDAYRLQEQGQDTYAANRSLGRGADERDYTPAAQMLNALGVGQIDLLTNNPNKKAQLLGLGIRLRRTVPTGVHVNPSNYHYLSTKVSQTHHTIEVDIEGIYL